MAALIIQQSYDAPGQGPVGLAFDGRSLWHADFSGGKIVRIDPRTFDVDRELICPGNLSGLTWDGRALWQSLHDGGALRRINPETNDFDQTILVAEHGWLSGVAWDGEHLWTPSQQNGTLFMLDRDSGEVIRTIPAPVAGGGLDYHDGSLWLGIAYPMAFDPHYEQFDWVGDEQHFAIVRLSPEDGAELDRYALDFVPMGLAWANGELWLSQVAARKLHRAIIAG